MSACGDSEVRVAAFFEKLAHFLAVFNIEAPQSEKLGMAFFTCERTNVANSFENPLVCSVLACDQCGLTIVLSSLF